MEFLFSIFTEIIKEPIQNFLIAPIKRHLSYAFNGDAHVKKLQEEAQQLKNKSDRLQHAVEDAQREGHEIYPNVTNWLTNADAAIQEAQALIVGEELKENKRCFMGLCPNLKTRYRVSKKACKRGQAIHELRNGEGLEPAFYPLPPKQMGAPSVYAREGLPSRLSVLKQVMDVLKDPNLNMVGVFGMGGVGKTTLAKEVHRQARDDKLFDSVIFVAVSQTPEITTIQREIAEALGLSLKAESILVRANELCERLKNEKQVLIILDDMWSLLELHKVGIPFGDDHGGCKIFVTSRSKDVCHDMGARKSFPINTLPEEEARSLFQTTIAEVKEEFLNIANEISEKCAGLPLLIVKVAKDLQRRKELYAWKNTLNQLSHFDDLDATVFSVLRSSYDNLADETKAFFLLCGIFGQSNICIENLVRYGVGLKLFKHSITINDTRNKLLTYIDALKAECLLLEGDMIGFVKMHDLVRDTACSILSEEQHAFIGMAGAELEEWPDRECTRISLLNCKINGTLKSLDCPNAELLLLSTEDPSLEIPDSFFEKIKKLRVFHFRGFRSVSLPSSLCSLTNLHSLCLHQCKLDDIAIIGELKQLWVLSLVGPEIVGLPEEMEQLTQLKSLDLTYCSGIKFIPANMLSKLCLLEELYLKNCWVLHGAAGEEILTELSGLSRLISLEIHVEDDMNIPETLADKLERYKILIGRNWKWNQERHNSTKMLKLHTSIHLNHGVKMLLKKAEEVHLKAMKGIKNLLDDLDVDGFLELKHLSLGPNNELLRFMNTTTKLVFPKLESLYMNKVKHLENIWLHQLAEGSFKELRTLKAEKCPRLKQLFLVSITESLLRLEELHVCDCFEMKEVIIREFAEESEVVEFTQLQSLKLEGLPQLTSFCNDKGDSTSSLFNKMVVFPNLESLRLWRLKELKNIWHNEMSLNSFFKFKDVKIGNCGRLTKIFPSHDIQRFQNLQKLTVERCAMVEEIFEIKEENNVYFPNLESLKLKCLDKLNNIWHGEITLNSFCKLKTLEIEKCGRLSRIFPLHVVQRLKKLQNLWVSNCGSVEEIFEIEEGNNNVSIGTPTPFELRDLKIQKLRRLKHIWSKHPKGTFTFENLQSVDVGRCDSLKHVFPASIAARDLSNLEKLKIFDSSIQEIVEMAGEVVGEEGPCFNFPKLTRLSLSGLQNITSFYPERHSIKMPILKKIKVKECSQKIVQFGQSNYKFLDKPRPLLFLDKMNFPSLEYMQIRNINELEYFSSGEFPIECFPQLKSIALRLHWTSGDEDLTSGQQLESGFLETLCSLSIQTLVVEDSRLSEVLFSNEGVLNDKFALPVKELTLSDLFNLKHIWKEDSQLKSLFKHLQSLYIKYCTELINIAPFSLSFENLAFLSVESCGQLRNLITTSTAKTMVQLKEMNVRDCQNITEIVANDTEEKDTIIFSKLRKLILVRLPKLTSFCSSSHSFNFPCLEQVQVWSCYQMKTFCHGDVSTPKLRAIENHSVWVGSINETIAFLFKR